MQTLITNAYNKAEHEYRKSNCIIRAKKKMTVYQSKLLNLSLNAIQQGKYSKSAEGSIVVELTANELKQRLCKSSGSFYKTLAENAESIREVYLGYNNPVSKVFDFCNIYNRVRYEDGVCKFYFNPELKDFLVNIENNFTLVDLDLQMSWNRMYISEIYESLISRCYLDDGTCKGDFVIHIPTAEFKFEIGFYDSTEKCFNQYLASKRNPDYDAAEKLIKDGKSDKNKYCRLGKFNQAVLNPCIDEINKNPNSSIFVFDKKGTEAHGLTFYIHRDTKEAMIKYRKEHLAEEETIAEPIDVDAKIEQAKIEHSNDEILSFIIKLSALFPEIQIEDLTKIAKAADYDLEVCKKAKKLTESYSKDINNLPGFIISAIKENWDAVPEGTKNSKKKKIANDFNNFKQTTYDDIDFEKFEKDILNN